MVNAIVCCEWNGTDRVCEARGRPSARPSCVSVNGARRGGMGELCARGRLCNGYPCLPRAHIPISTTRCGAPFLAPYRPFQSRSRGPGAVRASPGEWSDQRVHYVRQSRSICWDLLLFWGEHRHFCRVSRSTMAVVSYVDHTPSDQGLCG